MSWDGKRHGMSQCLEHFVSRHLTAPCRARTYRCFACNKVLARDKRRRMTTISAMCCAMLCYVMCYVLCSLVQWAAMGLISGCKDGEQSRKTISWMVSWHQMTPDDTRWHQEMVSYGLLLHLLWCTLAVWWKTSHSFVHRLRHRKQRHVSRHKVSST